LTDIRIEAARPGAALGFASFRHLELRCALGRGGITPDKVEGDGCTPAGRFPIRRLFYRPDRVREAAFRPPAFLPARPLAPNDGWCDDAADPAYNRLVALPYAARHETLWREDQLYDLLLVIGHNDDPVVPGKGSAVFLHLAHPDYRPTEGCVAFARADFISLLEAIDAASGVEIAGR